MSVYRTLILAGIAALGASAAMAQQPTGNQGTQGGIYQNPPSTGTRGQPLPRQGRSAVQGEAPVRQEERNPNAAPGPTQMPEYHREYPSVGH